MPSRLGLLVGIGVLLVSSLASAQKFFPDDPLDKEPPPRPTYGPEPRALSEILEAVSNSIGSPGEHHPASGVIPGGGINTLGDVMDGPWYVSRHGSRRMSREELLRGAGDENPPSHDGKWAALIVKPFGLRPGVLIRDAKDDIYVLRFDVAGHPETATGAEMVSSRFFHAFGYHVPQDYLIAFERGQLVASDSGEGVTSAGARRDLTELDIDTFLKTVSQNADGRYRAVATLAPIEWKGLLGPYQVYGVRTDDPNDIVPHEHRRDLRGLFVFSAWLNHNFMRAVNTLDAVVKDNGEPHIRHYLVDFSATLGSGGLAGIKRAWEGNDTILPRGTLLKNALGFGIYTPKWMRASYPSLFGLGRFGSADFDPEQWTSNHDIAPFANRLPDDEFWAAKQVMAFTDEDIRTVVSTGGYSDPATVEWIVQSLIERRDRIGQTYFAKVLPLDGFRVETDRLAFDDLEEKNGFVASRNLDVRWLELDNERDVLTLITGAEGVDVPRTVAHAPPGTYFAARIAGVEAEKEVTVFVRREGDGLSVVGVERSWPGKVIADPSREIDTGTSRYAGLDDRQKRLFETYARQYTERRGRSVTAPQYFDSLTISERTTFDAVTHALMHSKLTNVQGDSLGTAVDLVKGIERIAGQYYGRSGDQQFRLYVYLAPGAKEKLEESQEFHLGHLNTVYHAGYPNSFRQTGKEPTVQFSMSEDGTKADIDVDYRSSRSPQALFNGHLTSANSDVREGDNYWRHNARWGGFVAWWQELFGELASDLGSDRKHDLLATDRPEIPTLLPPNRPMGATISEVQDAVQEFLADWLVRHDYDEALEFLSPSSYACMNLDDDMDEEALGSAEARNELRTLMRYAVGRLGDRANLTEAIDAVSPWDPKRVVERHPFESDFTLVKMSAGDAAEYLCGQSPARPSGAEYVGVLFRFKRRGSAILGLLWRKDDAAAPWRIVSYRTFEQ